jgi:hypothetical protein
MTRSENQATGSNQAARERDSQRSLRIASVQFSFRPNMMSSQGARWIPTEPNSQLDPLSTSRNWLALQDLDITDEGANDVLGSCESESYRIYEENLILKIKQVLEYCRSNGVDLVVLPEYSVPPSLLPVLSGFTRHMSVLAGLGYVRAQDADLVASFVPEAEPAADHNCAVFLSGASGGNRLITKKCRVGGEIMEPGSGPAFVDYVQGDQTFHLGIGICLDYLRNNFHGTGAHVVLVPAHTSSCEPFLNRTPRDYALVLANNAYHGGSAIQMTDMQAGAFVDSWGSQPIPAGIEAVTIVDIEGFGTKPTALSPAQNRLIARGGIFYDAGDPSADAQLSTASVARAMGEWTLEDYSAGQYSSLLKQALSGDHVESLLLRECLQKLERQGSRGVLTRRDFDLYTDHMVMTGVLTEEEVKYKRLGIFVEQFRAWMDQADIEIPKTGQYYDEYKHAMNDLAPKVSPVHMRAGNRFVGASVDEAGERTGAPRRFFAARLGKYDSSNAVRSLPRQLGILRSIAAFGAPDLRILYRLSTEPQASGDLSAFFDVLGVAGAGADDALVESLSESIGQEMGVAFSGGWNVSGTRAPTSPSSALSVELALNPGIVPRIAEDWAGLVDYIRALRVPVTVQMSCEPSQAQLSSPRDGTDSERLVDPEGFLDPVDRDATAYLQRASQETEGDTRSLALRLWIGSDAPLPPSVVYAIGYRLFAGADFTSSPAASLDPYSTPSTSSGLLLRPAEALRIFHPPYGHIDGRGLSSQRPTSIAVPSGVLSSGGVLLGTARSAFGRSDRTVEVRVDDDSRLRHAYLIGKTGSGKTNLLKLMARQDIASGKGVAVIDPHGDLVDYLLGHVGDRLDEVLLLDFGNPDRSPVLNPLDLDCHSNDDRALAIEEFIQLLVHQSYHEFYGPRFEDIVRLTLESISRDEYPWHPSVLDLVRILRSKSRRQWLHDLLDDPDLVERWNIFERQQPSEIAEVLHWALSKFSEMSRDGVLSHVISGGPSTVSIADTVKGGGVLLVRIPEWEISASAAAFLGAFVQERVRRAAYARVGRFNGGEPAQPFFLYVDEFQTFATSGFEEVVAEARKFGLGLTLANQNLGQLTRFSRFTGDSSGGLLEAVLGNVSTVAVLPVSHKDATVFAAEFGIRVEDVQNIGKYSGLMRIHVRGEETPAFTVDIPSAESDRGLPASRDAVIERMVESGKWRLRQDISAEVASREIEMSERARAHRSRSDDKGFIDGWRTKIEDAASAGADEEAPDDDEAPPGTPADADDS